MITRMICLAMEPTKHHKKVSEGDDDWILSIVMINVIMILKLWLQRKFGLRTCNT